MDSFFLAEMFKDWLKVKNEPINQAYLIEFWLKSIWWNLNMNKSRIFVGAIFVVLPGYNHRTSAKRRKQILGHNIVYA